MVVWSAGRPRSVRSSSTLRKESENRRYHPTAQVITAGSKWRHLNKGGRDFRTLAAYQDGSPARVHSLATLPIRTLARNVFQESGAPRRFDDKDAGLPVVPDGAQPSPQESIRGCQFRSLDGALQNAELMAGCRGHFSNSGGLPRPAGPRLEPP
jgi:hypothetical protein